MNNVPEKEGEVPFTVRNISLITYSKAPIYIYHILIYYKVQTPIYCGGLDNMLNILNGDMTVI